MEHDHSGEDGAAEGPTGPDDRDGLEARIRQARREVTERLDPAPPPLSEVRARVQRQHRRLALTAASIVVVLAVVTGVLVTRDGAEDEDEAVPVDVEFVRSDKPRTSGDADAIPAAVEADTAFAVDLYRQLATTEDGNFFLSPHSISMALSMTMAGADGDTLDQMEQALHLAVPEPAFHDAINALDQALTAPRTAEPDDAEGEPLELATANSLWGQAGYPFRQQFLDRIAQSYDAGMNVVDFEREAEASRLAINAWVAERTDGKITELIPKGVIDGLTRLVLVNTITFKASWVDEFEDARPGPFTTADGTKVTAQMMSHGTGAVATGDGWQSVSIPYVGGAHLLVIVPDDLADFEQTLTPEVLAAAADAQGPADVTLPKFSVTSDLDLIPTLASLGIEDLFKAGEADLSRIDGTNGLYVSAAIHQATIDVDEKGTQAAAATAVIVGLSSAPAPFEVDKPFIFAIRDDATGAILFTGRVTDPTA